MIQYDIPGRGPITIEHLVIDFNGTLAEDGQLIDQVADQLLALSKLVKVYIATADTYGSVKKQCSHLPVEIYTFSSNKAASAKRSLVEDLGAQNSACIGNGFNDVEMMSIAVLSVAVIGTEGLASSCLRKADIIAPSIQSALNILLKPNRLKATLRH